MATRIPNQRSENGTKQQTKSEARPNEPSEPRAWFLERRERELAVLWLCCGWSSLGGQALCASVLIPSLQKLKELAGQDNVGTLVAALAALSEAAEPRVPPSPAAG